MGEANSTRGSRDVEDGRAMVLGEIDELGKSEMGGEELEDV